MQLLLFELNSDLACKQMSYISPCIVHELASKLVMHQAARLHVVLFTAYIKLETFKPASGSYGTGKNIRVLLYY